jgi:hypothetical protein
MSSRGLIRRKFTEFAKFGIGIRARSGGFARKKVHGDHCSTQCPEPVAAWHTGLDEKCSCHRDGSAPLTLNGSIL